MTPKKKLIEVALPLEAQRACNDLEQSWPEIIRVTREQHAHFSAVETPELN